MKRQFTATVYIFDENERVLLLHHRKFNKWMPPGGHLDPNETPVEAARREVREETGLEIDFITHENVWIEHGNAKSFERPYLCLLEEIPEHGSEPKHQHMDFVYLARPNEGIVQHNERESADIAWFSWEQVQLLDPSTDIFRDSLVVLQQIYENQPIEILHL